MLVAKHRSSRSWPWTAAAAILIVATIGVAWADHESESGRVVANNVSFRDTDVSRQSVDRIREIVSDRADEVLSASVTVEIGSDTFDYEAHELGFTYDTALVVSQIMAARHEGNLLERVLAWIRSAIDPIIIGESFGYEPDVARETLSGDPRLVLTEPVEPEVTLTSSGFGVIEGVVGGRVDVENLVARLGDQDPTRGPSDLDAERVGLPPTVTDDTAAEVARSLNDLTVDGVQMLVGATPVELGPSLLRRHITTQTLGGSIRVEFDAERLHTLLEGLVREPVTSLTKPTFEIEEEVPIVLNPGEPPLECCDRDSVQRAAELIMAGAANPIRVEPRPADDPRLEAWASGELITEKVSEFTTRHACCQGRVTNIHRIADIVRGLYLLPDETVSLNEFVGRRTRAKGFVAAGAIRAGHLEDEVGGGVSQFATTIFNAAFFAGLDIPVYQSHSLYFSRYPFGREATISHPAPDLVLHNTTDYPVLIWTSYTGTSITVSMYSTQNVVSEDIGQRVGSWRSCTYVETDRQRTYEDGRVEVDTFEALYRPGDGLDCNGNVIPQS